MFRYVAVLALAAICPIAASSQAADKSKGSVDPQDKLVCKSFPVTGSLVDSKKVCKTNRDWQKERDDLRLSNGSTESCRQRAEGGAC